MNTAIAALVRWRLGIPCILFLLLSSLDRANISFAARTMNAELGFTPAQYGFGAGVLFVGFLIGQYPSMALLQRIGMRRWMALCALLWGGAAGGMAFIETQAQFYALRVVVGLAEGGLAPGIVYYLSQFATERERAGTFSFPMLAIPLSVVIGAPLSGWLITTGDALGFTGWRFMFVMEALPTMVAGLAAWAWLPDTPAQARWLDDAQKQWLQANAARRAGQQATNDWTVLRRPVVLLGGLLWFCLLSGAYGMIFWLPQVMQSLSDLTTLQTGFAGALPFLGLALGMYFNANHSDRTGERCWHIAAPALLAAVALLVAWQVGPGPAALLALFVTGLGLGGAQGAFWALPTTVLTPATMAVAVVGINIFGSAGGLVMPQLMGVARQATGGFALPTLLVVAVLVAAAVLVGAIRWVYRREFAAATAPRS
jgi:MFS transporter, ACS family, tartrate transporter